MPGQPSRTRTLALTFAFIAGLALVACGGDRAGAPSDANFPLATDVPPTLTPSPELTRILALPDAFRFELTLRATLAADEPATVITGQYRAGSWSQSTQRGSDQVEELVVAVEGSDGAQRSFTRPAVEPDWTRWPGIGFDAGYGLSSPFAVLRLFPMADAVTDKVLEPVPGAPEATFKVQATFEPETVRTFLAAGASAVASENESRAVLQAQLAPLAVSQAITYWVDDAGRIYRAEATLQADDGSGSPQPWVHALWRFWGYDDATIAVASPGQYSDVPGLDAAAQPESPAEPAAAQPEVAVEPEPAPTFAAEADPGINLRVRVFATAGRLAEQATVTVYPAGNSRDAIEWRNAPDAQFSLPAGAYDVLVQVDYAEEWLKKVDVVADKLAAQEVVFDFGTLELTVLQGDQTPTVDIVVYPAGERDNWVDWRSENPTAINLRAGTYDVEVALPDLSGTKAVEGIVITAGRIVRQTVDLTK